jgi:hypothetical protein
LGIYYPAVANCFLFLSFFIYQMGNLIGLDPLLPQMGPGRSYVGPPVELLPIGDRTGGWYSATVCTPATKLHCSTTFSRVLRSYRSGCRARSSKDRIPLSHWRPTAYWASLRRFENALSTLSRFARYPDRSGSGLLPRPGFSWDRHRRPRLWRLRLRCSRLLLRVLRLRSLCLRSLWLLRPFVV